MCESINKELDESQMHLCAVLVTSPQYRAKKSGIEDQRHIFFVVPLLTPTESCICFQRKSLYVSQINLFIWLLSAGGPYSVRRNHLPAVHVKDAAQVYRLAMESEGAERWRDFACCPRWKDPFQEYFRGSTTINCIDCTSSSEPIHLAEVSQSSKPRFQ